MALQAKSSASHNRMLGQKIRHPPSTNFDDDFQTPAAKRLKCFESTDSSLSRNGSDQDDELDSNISKSPRVWPKEVADSEAESEDEDFVPRPSQTELETSLPLVKTDKEAIAEYEAARAAESADVDVNLHSRLGQRKWVRGKSSIYVDAFNLALETVLEEESHLFDAAEMAVFHRWRSLSYEGQYL